MTSDNKAASIKTEIKRDSLQHQVLDPIFPHDLTNGLDSGKSPAAPAKTSKSRPNNPL